MKKKIKNQDVTTKKVVLSMISKAVDERDKKIQKLQDYVKVLEREVKEITQSHRDDIDYFRNITCRVGSKSIKKEDVYNFKVII